MAIARDDRWTSDAQGRALSGALVYWCTQPATVPTPPAAPSPLAVIYADISGTTPETQPVVTDGFGHAFAYMDDSVLYTVVFYHPLFGPNPIILKDQALGSGGGGGATLHAFEGTPTGTLDGTNKVFTLAVPASPVYLDVSLNIVLIPGLGYTAAWVSGTLTITYAVAPQPASGPIAGDALYVKGFYSA